LVPAGLVVGRACSDAARGRGDRPVGDRAAALGDLDEPLWQPVERCAFADRAGGGAWLAQPGAAGSSLVGANWRGIGAAVDATLGAVRCDLALAAATDGAGLVAGRAYHRGALSPSGCLGRGQPRGGAAPGAARAVGDRKSVV